VPGHLATTFRFSLLLPLSHPRYPPHPLLPLLPMPTPWALHPHRSPGLQDQPMLQLQHPSACLSLASENHLNPPVQTQQRGVTSLGAVLLRSARCSAHQGVVLHQRCTSPTQPSPTGVLGRTRRMGRVWAAAAGGVSSRRGGHRAAQAQGLWAAARAGELCTLSP